MNTAIETISQLETPALSRDDRGHPSVTPEESRQLYGKFCRPRNAALMRALRLDKVYHRASGDHLYYKDEEGREQSVIDFLGGYGASLFGHTHPALRRALTELLDREVPFNAQASCRNGAAQLCAKLNGIVRESTGHDYVITLANSGAEAVEAALKHAEMVRVARLDSDEDELRKLCGALQEGLTSYRYRLAPNFFSQARAMFRGLEATSFAEVAAACRQRVREVFSRPPFFLSLEGAFHGKTVGAVQLTYNRKYRAPFARIGPQVRFIPVGDVPDLEHAAKEARWSYPWFTLGDNGEIALGSRTISGVSALFGEPIQGEGGIREVPWPFLQECRRVASAERFPLIFDEIQSGMGRTGTFLASEPSGVVADYYLLSKSLGGGLAKISALLVQKDQYDPEFGYLHSSTFAEDEHSATVALRALELLMEERLIERAREAGERLRSGLLALQQQYPDVIEEVRGRGLLLGLALVDRRDARAAVIRGLASEELLGYVAAGYLLHEHGLRVAPTLSRPNTLRIQPSAYVGTAEIQKLLSGLERLCHILHNENSHRLTRFVIGGEKRGDTSEIRSYRRPRTDVIPEEHGDLPRVAFLGHLIDVGDMPLWDPSLEGFAMDERREYLDRVWAELGPAVYNRVVVTSSTGDRVLLTMLGLALDSRIIARKMGERDLKALRQFVYDAGSLAESLGCSALGLGGYTSIVTRNATTIYPRGNLALTTGNSLTVAMGIEALLTTARERNIELSRARFAALGATGNIASVYSEIIAESVPSITLIGRPGSEARLLAVAYRIYGSAFNQACSANENSDPSLRGVARAIRESRVVTKRQLNPSASREEIGRQVYEALQAEMGEEAPVRIATGLDCLKRSNIILGASNSPDPVIFPEMLNDGPVVICDISVPADAAPDISRRCPNVSVIQGGIVRLANNHHFEIGGIPLEKGHSFACMTETLLMGLTGIREHYSFGSVSPVRVKRIMELARIHGFSLARPKLEASY